MVTICVDAMGGDEDPKVVLAGIAQALAADPELTVLVAGDEDVVVPFCASNERARALVTTEVIGMGEHPTQAVRAKRDSSIVRGCKAVKDGEAQGFFSAGATGAILAAATLVVGRMHGMKRPAIASAMPGLGEHETVMLDIGANADVRPEMYVQFATMGVAYARVELGVDEPCVALLSNGEEEAKGNEATIAAHQALKASDINFVGNCEGNDVLMGDFDVIVCDGFTGNVSLKSIEGTAKFIISKIREAASDSKLAGVGALMLKPAIAGVGSRLSGEGHGGAVLLGLKAPVLIGHGATSEVAVKNGIRSTAEAVRGDLVGKIAAACE